MFAILAALGWAIIALISFYVWIRIIKKARGDPTYIASLKEAGIYQRYQIGKFTAFIMTVISLLFFMTSLVFTGLV